jgi:hypothetical protein
LAPDTGGEWLSTLFRLGWVRGFRGGYRESTNRFFLLAIRGHYTPDPAFCARRSTIYNSARILALQKELETGNGAALEKFWDEIVKQSAPLIELDLNSDKHCLVTFLWRGNKKTKGAQLVSDLTESLQELRPRAGSSLGGLAASFTALRHADIFGNVLSQSGVYSGNPTNENSADWEKSEWLTKQFVTSPKLPVRFLS